MAAGGWISYATFQGSESTVKSGQNQPSLLASVSQSPGFVRLPDVADYTAYRINPNDSGAPPMMIRLLLSLWLFAASIAAHAQNAWMLASRESGCVGLQLLVKMERLSHAPASPDEFA
jgi:hypothetical protein